jgi:6-methylsalicylate decarboxylase
VPIAPPRTDVHQHLWPPELLGALSARAEPPFARRGADGWTLHLTGEPPSRVQAEDGAQRATTLPALGVDRAIVSLSTALRVERLDPGEARPLVDAWRHAGRGLPRGLQAWGALNLTSATPGDVDALLDEDFVGLCVPAQELAHPHRVEGLAPLLHRLEQRDGPLFVHPGPATARGWDADPPWWPALTSYLASLQAAWWAWAAVGVHAHPRLRVLFAALAGLAPLHAERAGARGGPAPPTAAPLFYDTSSYGPEAIGAIARAVGSEHLVFGSDLPVVDAVAPADDALLRDNPARLLR